MIENYKLFESDELETDVKKILVGRINYVFELFESSIKDYKFKVISFDEIKRLYLINSKYIVFVGLMYYPYAFLDKSEYNEKTDDYYIDKTFKIIIDEMIYDNDLRIDYNSIISKYLINNQKPSIQLYETYQYFERTFKGETTWMFDDNDKFYTIAEYFKDKIDLYKYLEENQNNQTIENNYDINDLVKYYEDICRELEKYFNDYNYKIMRINSYEKIYLLEDSLVIYVGAKGSNSLFRDKDEMNGNVFDRYNIVIQELTYNGIFKSRKFSKFIKSINIMKSKRYDSYHGNNINYRPFAIGNSEEKIVKGYRPRFYNKSNFQYVNSILPNLKLQERFDNWEGELRNYIVYEFIYYKGKVGYAVSSTLETNPRMAARTILRQYENNAGYLMYYPGIIYDDSWGYLMNKFVEEQKKLKWSGYKKIGNQSSIMAEKVQYFVVPVYVNNKNIHEDIIGNLIKDVKAGKYVNAERTLYDISEYKWKSEELMYECVKKVFKNREVIHQYRPYFLGQQSYDVFVCKENFAFEYQGKQHFEAVEIFGGEEALKENQKRDAKKAELSKKNGIKLIYINYWEDVTEELIREKIKDVNND